jgi:hypothetical protein
MYAIYNLIIHNRVLWLCWAVLIYAVFTLWSIHTDLQPALTHNNQRNWQQPIATDTKFPFPISAQQWHFDFEVTQSILGKVKLSHSNKLLLNQELVAVLTLAVDSLPKEMSGKALQQAAFLIAKGLTGAAGEKLSVVFINYYQLQQATNKVKESRVNFDLTDNYSIFKATTERQNYYLGHEVAHQLFGKKRIITGYLYKRKAIKENSNLSHKQKKKQLHTLKKQHENTLNANPLIGQAHG